MAGNHSIVYTMKKTFLLPPSHPFLQLLVIIPIQCLPAPLACRDATAFLVPLIDKRRPQIFDALPSPWPTDSSATNLNSYPRPSKVCDLSSTARLSSRFRTRNNGYSQNPLPRHQAKEALGIHHRVISFQSSSPPLRRRPRQPAILPRRRQRPRIGARQEAQEEKECSRCRH